MTTHQVFHATVRPYIAQWLVRLLALGSQVLRAAMDVRRAHALPDPCPFVNTQAIWKDMPDETAPRIGLDALRTA